MLAIERAQCLRDVVWNADKRGNAGKKAMSYYVECWNYTGMTSVHPDVYWRDGWLGNVDPEDGQLGPGDEQIGMWVRHEGHYKPPIPKAGTGALQGGIRLLLCDRPNMTPGMTISRTSFELIESTFKLPTATLPSFALVSGVCSEHVIHDPKTGAITRLSVVVKANQKVEIANYLLSMTHDFVTGWTTAFICGDGVIQPRGCDRTYGSQLLQIVDLVKSSTGLSTHPLLVPTALLYVYYQRTAKRTHTLERQLIELENELGVTFAGGAGLNLDEPQENWPEYIDVKKTTIGLHSTTPQIIFMQRACDWARRFGDFVLKLEEKISKDPTVKIDESVSRELRESIMFVASSLEAIHGFFRTLQERAQTQLGVLYSVVSQQDSLINRRDNKLNISIASSSKKDSIAMMTFTFITTLFLPGTYISSLFSTTMFNWQTSASSSGSDSRLSSYFWVYWAVTIPLTLVALGGWYVWYRYADKQWHKTLNAISSQGGKQVIVENRPKPWVIT